MLCDLYVIVEKGRVYVVDKMNVEGWGQFLMLIKINCLMIVALQKLHETQGLQSKFHGLYIYIYLFDDESKVKSTCTFWTETLKISLKFTAVKKKNCRF